MQRQDGIQTRLAEMVDYLTAMYAENYRIRTPSLVPPAFSVTYAKKYAKIALTHRHQLSDGTIKDNGGYVYCFIDLSNGDILKPAGWKAPAKGKRGSIWNDDCDVGPSKPCNVHGGGLYLR